MTEEVQTITLPEGRVINCDLFERDAYKPEGGTEGKPMYKAEIAFEPDDVEGEDTVEDDLIEAACNKWGDGAEEEFLEGDIIDPRLDGDKLAKKREANDKDGDAYKGKLVIRPNTMFNQHGEDGPGGIYVVGPDNKPILAAESHKVYPGCYGIAIVTISTYTDSRGDKALKFYLVAFQKTRDGDKLVTGRDYSSMFKKVGREKGGTKRRSRKG